MRCLLMSTVFAGAGFAAQANTITAESVFHFVDRVGTRSYAPGPEQTRLAFGLFRVNLDSTEGTSGTYEQNGVSGSLFDVSSSFNNRKEFAAVEPFDPSLTGSWTLTMENNGVTTVFNTPEVGLSSPPNFVTNVAQIGSGTTPTFTFTPPAGIDDVQIQILDLRQSRVSLDIPDIIFEGEISPTATSFTVPDGILSTDGIYSIVFQADINRPGEDNLLARSRVYYDFSSSELALPDVVGADSVPVFLPQTDTTSGTPIFNFDNPVVKDELAFFDPIETVIGYDFAVGTTDEVLFSSVVLPSIGDGMFELLLKDESGLFSKVADLVAGTEFSFGEGVDMFRILGIEPGLLNDPADTTAFVTGLRFNASGQFTGTMTPIVAPIPLPAAAWLLLSGLVGLFALRRPARSAP